MIAVDLQRVIQAIQDQMPALGKDRFTIDPKVAEVARNQFLHNYNRHSCRSRCASLAGVASFAGFGFSLYKLFISPVTAITFTGISYALNRFWVNNRNQEGYVLQNALDTKDEDEIIRQLSLGANIYQKVWPIGGAAANLFNVLKGGPRTVMQTFAEAGYTKVLAYVAMLEPDLLKRTQMVTEALPFAINRRTAQLLLDLGGNIQGAKNLFSFCCLRRDIDLAQFFVEAGARLDAGIPDYQQWQADFDKRQREFGSDWYPDNNKGVSPTLHPGFKTPLEKLLTPSQSVPSPLADSPTVILEAMRVTPATYKNQKSADELYHSLNQAGVRIRRQYAEDLFARL